MKNRAQMTKRAPWSHTGYDDAGLMLDGRIALHGNDWQCRGLIVGELDEMRWWHNCCDEKGHDGPHECSCGQTWWWQDGTLYTRGPLTEVAIDNRRDYPAGVPMARFGLDELGPERVVYVKDETKAA